ncbi:SPS-sensor component PTR3 [Nakaseomyces bracarensis]
MIMRLNELGSQIHKCEVSPRNDAIAFLDKNGSVYIMSTPAIMDNEKRRVALVDIVANSHRAYESASLRFSPEGHQLYLVDRKGILYVEDFAAGQPQDLDITRCKQIE